MATQAELLKAASDEFWKREDVYNETHRLFIIEEWSDEMIAHSFNLKIEKKSFLGFNPPEGFALTRKSVTNHRQNCTPPITRPVQKGKNTAKRNASVTLPQRRHMATDDVEGIDTGPFMLKDREKN